MTQICGKSIKYIINGFHVSVTDFFINEAISNVEEGARLIGGAEEHKKRLDEVDDTTP